MPQRFQSRVELRLSDGRDPLLIESGLSLNAGDVVSLLMSAEVRRAVADSDVSPRVASTDEWFADHVTAVWTGQDTIFILVRDKDPVLAATSANALESAARQIRKRRLDHGLRGMIVRLEREHERLLGQLEEFDPAAEVALVHPSLQRELHRLRWQAGLTEVVDLERRMSHVHELIREKPVGWRLVEAASPRQQLLRKQNGLTAVVAILLPTLMACIAWLVHDRRYLNI